MGMHCRGPVKVRPRTRATAHRFVVLIGVVAKEHIVHRPLAGREHAKGTEQRVGHHLTRLRIPRDNRRRVFRRQHTAFRNDDVDRLETALVQWDLIIDQRAEDIEHGRPAHRGRRVEVGRSLRAGAGEIDRCFPLLFVKANLDLHHAAFVQRIGELAVLHHVDDTAHLFFRIILNVAHIGVHHVETKLFDHTAHFTDAFFTRRDLCLEVGHVVIRLPGRVTAGAEMRAQLVLQELTRVDQFEIVEENTFLFDRCAIGRR